MSVPRQQPHAIAKFKHQQRTSAPVRDVVPAHMVPYEYSWDRYDHWLFGKPGLTESERKRYKARAARKARK